MRPSVQKHQACLLMQQLTENVYCVLGKIWNVLNLLLITLTLTKTFWFIANTKDSFFNISTTLGEFEQSEYNISERNDSVYYIHIIKYLLLSWVKLESFPEWMNEVKFS